MLLLCKKINNHSFHDNSIYGDPGSQGIIVLFLILKEMLQTGHYLKLFTASNDLVSYLL